MNRPCEGIWVPAEAEPPKKFYRPFKKPVVSFNVPLSVVFCWEKQKKTKKSGGFLYEIIYSTQEKPSAFGNNRESLAEYFCNLTIP